jgi:hypothetical protein
MTPKMFKYDFKDKVWLLHTYTSNKNQTVILGYIGR